MSPVTATTPTTPTAPGTARADVDGEATAAASCSPEGIVAMGRLRAVADELGYAQLYAALCAGALFPADHTRAGALASSLGGPPAAALRLLALGEAVETVELTGSLAELAERLAAAGLVRSDAGGVRLDGLVLVPVLGGLLLTGTPPTYPAGAPRAGRAYLGEDSLRLAAALPYVGGRRVLDLGTGCGVQGILAARDAAEVVCTDLEARSVELTGLNACLNGRAGHVSVLAGDTYAPVAGDRFDLVVSLPPYLPELPGADGVVAAGPDGLGLLRRLVAGAPDHLRPGGELVALAQLLCDDDGPLLAHELPSLAPGLAARVVAFDHHRLQPYVLELSTRLAATTGGEVAESQRALLSSLRAQGVTGVCTAFLRLRAPGATGAGAGAGAGAALEVRSASRRLPGDVLVPGPGLRIGVATGLVGAAVAGGPPMALPQPTAALLAALDGERDLAAATAAAWGQPQGADVRDLVDQAIERAATLEQAGLVRLQGC